MALQAICQKLWKQEECPINSVRGYSWWIWMYRSCNVQSNDTINTTLTRKYYEYGNGEPQISHSLIVSSTAAKASEAPNGMAVAGISNCCLEIWIVKCPSHLVRPSAIMDYDELSNTVSIDLLIIKGVQWHVTGIATQQTIQTMHIFHKKCRSVPLTTLRCDGS